jgi:hypothetical protein
MATKRSNLWQNITASLFSEVDEEFVASFRSPGGANARLAAWDPYDKSMRYYKFLLYNTARLKDAGFFDLYKRLGNVGIGQPVSVTIAECEINVDHLFAVEEFCFLSRNVALNEIRTVVEIGAGFGRTCHALLSLSPSVERYTIIDLPEVLALSRLYLRQAIPLLFDKIDFVDCESTELFEGSSADLAINIDSFQEMAPEVIDSYMNKVVLNCRAFYCKNPTGKYAPDCVGLPALTPEQLMDVYSLGYCREVIDLFNEKELVNSAKKYLSAYLPPDSFSCSELVRWKLVAEEPMAMFPYLHHALYSSYPVSVRG